MTSPAKLARLNAGYTVTEAAKKLKRSPRYVRLIEQRGGASDIYCMRAARLFKCNPDYFFLPPRYWQQLADKTTVQQAEAVVSASLPLLGRRLEPTG